MNCVALQGLMPGEHAQICSLNLFGGKRRRLLDLGFQPDAQVVCAYRAPAGSPIAFWVKGTLIALRSSDCKKILVKRDD